MDPLHNSNPEEQTEPVVVGDVTLLLHRMSSGDKNAEQDLFDLIFAELRRLASSKLRRERPGHTLQATALVNEAYMKMVQNALPEWHGRSHFMALAAQAMRRILADYGRAHNAEKRSGYSNALPIDLASGSDVPSQQPMEASDLDDALTRLAKLDPSGAKIVEMQYFGGLTQDQIAETLGCSSRTVKRKWEKARAWLREDLKP